MGILGLIPARGGSKGVPRKNIQLVGGKPLIAWTWAAARAATSLTRLLVSTDDPEIAALARAAGVEVPFMRPAELASDTTLAIEVVLHALDYLATTENYRPAAVLWLQPTSPLRTTADIEAAVALFKAQAADSVVSVCPVEHQHPMLLKRIEAGGRLRPWLDDPAPPQRRQEMPPVFALNGAIYLTRCEVLLEQGTFHPDRTFAYVMPPERSLDVDTPWDLYLADLILTEQAEREHN